MAQYKLTPEAKADLEEIAFTSERQFGQAQRLKYIRGLQEKVQQLAARPNIGRNQDKYFEGLKSGHYLSHILYYVEQSEGIVIVRILHKRMDAQNHLSS